MRVPLTLTRGLGGIEGYRHEPATETRGNEHRALHAVRLERICALTGDRAVRNIMFLGQPVYQFIDRPEGNDRASLRSPAGTGLPCSSVRRTRISNSFFVSILIPQTVDQSFSVFSLSVSASASTIISSDSTSLLRFSSMPSFSLTFFLGLSPIDADDRTDRNNDTGDGLNKIGHYGGVNIRHGVRAEEQHSRKCEIDYSKSLSVLFIIFFPFTYLFLHSGNDILCADLGTAADIINHFVKSFCLLYPGSYPYFPRSSRTVVSISPSLSRSISRPSTLRRAMFIGTIGELIIIRVHDLHRGVHEKDGALGGKGILPCDIRPVGDEHVR